MKLATTMRGPTAADRTVTGCNPHDEQIEEVISNHVRPRFVTEHRGPGARERLKGLLSLFAQSGHDEPPDEVLALMPLLGIDDEVQRELTWGLEQVKRVGIDFQAVLPVFQAYSRAVARVAEAESTLVHHLLRQIPEAERAAYLDQMFTVLLPLCTRGFEVLHSSLLDTTLRDELAREQLELCDSAPVCVALVDVCGSTTFLAEATDRDAERLVDALFEAGQLCVLTRSVRVLKYVGDGIFLIGRDPGEVAAACFDAVDAISAKLPLTARAGLAFGPVLRRAGDCFGLAVNLAQLLTKEARPGTVLATAAATTCLPPEARGPHRRLRIRSRSDRLEVVTLVRDPLRPG